MPDDQAPLTGPPSVAERSSIATIEVVALVLTIACGLAAWGMSLSTCGYDYDEVTRAHSVWLSSQGLRPYNDFFECHPPYFKLLVPLIRGRLDPLPALRVFASVGNLLFLAGLGVLGASLVPEGRRWAWLGLAIVAFHPDVFHFLVEFRIDGWGYALATWSIYRHQRLAQGLYREFELGVVTGVATLLFCPKLTILPGLIVVFGQIRAWSTTRRAALAIGSYASGVGLAAALGFAYLVWQKIDLNLMAQLLVRYNVVGGANSGFRYGLLGAIRANETLVNLLLVGAVAWVVARFRQRSWPGAYELALLAWLAAQVALVSYPHKQYYAPWFLFASSYLGFFGQGSSVWLRRARLVPFLAACAITGQGVIQTAQGWSTFGEVKARDAIIRWMDRVAGPGDRVVATPPLHPVDRYDTFFVWFNTASSGGFGAEQILSTLPSYRDNVTASRFLEELEAHPPAFVIVSGGWRMVSYTEGQRAALDKFLPTRGYQPIQVGQIRFAVRPDRLDQAR